MLSALVFEPIKQTCLKCIYQTEVLVQVDLVLKTYSSPVT